MVAVRGRATPPFRRAGRACRHRKKVPMHPSRLNFGSMALALFLAAGVPASVAIADTGGRLTTTRERGATSLGLDGHSFRTTQASVANPRLITLPNSSTAIALWDEFSGKGAPEHYYGLSLDGGRSFALVLPTTYVVRLVYAGFDPAAAGEPVIPAGLRSAADSN